MTAAIHRICKVGPDGNVLIPVGVEEAGSEVMVTVSPPAVPKLARDMTPEEHRNFILSIAGQWVGDFPEMEDLPPEERDPL